MNFNSRKYNWKEKFAMLDWLLKNVYGGIK